ncbi:MAG: hypothetical protein WBM70_10135 [Sulfurovum sp.]|jgi:capsular polysaccharide biosynthesis protein
MEPNLKDIDDYEKPISKSKLKNIIIAFIAVMIVSGSLAYLLNTIGR